MFGLQSYICQFADCYLPRTRSTSGVYVIGTGVYLYVCLLPTRGSKQGKVIGAGVHIYIHMYVYTYIYICLWTKKNLNHT